MEKRNMALHQIFNLFPVDFRPMNQILLITPDLFYKIKGIVFEKARVHILVCEGTLDIDINGKSHEMKAHSFLDVFDNMSFVVEKCDSDLRAWALIVTFEFVSESLKNLRPYPATHLLHTHYTPIWNFSSQESDIVETQLSLMQNSLSEPRKYFWKDLAEMYYRSFCLQIGSIMFVKDDNLEEFRTYMNKKDFVTWQFLKLVTKHYKEQHNIEFYAESLFVSVKHLSRIIKEMTGATPYTFICRELLHNAMGMLENENLSIAQIADELHFADQASFCKFFKKHKEISPMAYRRKVIK